MLHCHDMLLVPAGKVARPKEYREVKEVQQEVKKGWADKIIVSQDMQVRMACWLGTL